MEIKRIKEKVMLKEIKSLVQLIVLLTLIAVFSLLGWLIGDAHWSWLIVTVESIVVVPIVCWRVARDFERYYAARELEIAGDVRRHLLDELKQQEELALKAKEKGTAFSKEEKMELLKARCNSLELKLAELEAAENPWRCWFEATCKAFADIIRGQELQPRFKIKKKDFEYAMVAHHGKEEKIFKVAFDDAWKCVPEMVKNKKGRPSN